MTITTSDLGNTGAGGVLIDTDVVDITVQDTTGPTVTDVTSSTANGSYGPGQGIMIQVGFSEAVNVTGSPQLTLETGSNDGIATYFSGSGTSVLLFNYTVLVPHGSADLDCTGTDALTLNGATIRDAAGNDAVLTLPVPGATGSLSANKDIVIDTAVAAPNTPDLQASSDTGTLNTDNITDITTPTFDIAGVESGATVALTFTPIGGGEAIVVQALVAAGQSTCTITVTPPLSPGVYTVTARQTDLAGNISIASAALAPSLVVDTTAPIAPVVGGTTPTYDATPTWSWTSGGGGDGTYRYKLDDSDLSSGATTTAATSFMPETDLAEGAHVLYVQESDAAGNWSDSGSFEIVVEVNELPMITEGAGPLGQTIDEDNVPTAFALTLHATDADGDALTWSILTPASHGTATVTTGTGASQVINYTPALDYNTAAGGAESFVVQVDDGLGGTDTITVNVTVNARNDGPINTVPGAQVVDEDTNLGLLLRDGQRRRYSRYRCR